jgi:3-deoxy-manno-octulosonate cytidylyltransferase (CMP-KDO synthetase)
MPPDSDRPDTAATMHTGQALVVIPARMASTRLPGKPLADIGGVPMIVHVMRRAQEARLGRVAVATDHAEIAGTVAAHGGEAVMTATSHESGSDRIWEAVCRIDPQEQAQFVINLQGDLPTISADAIVASLTPLLDGPADIGTLAIEIVDPADAANPNIVKIVGSPVGDRHLRALYFTRAQAPWGDGPLYHHIGIYAYRRSALARFVALKQSALEKRERLEQLRAIEAGMRIDVSVIDSAPFGVDTAADLEKARAILAGGKDARHG